MNQNHVVKRTAPRPPYTCELFSIDIEAIPYMLQALYWKSLKFFWTTPEEWKYGRRLINLQMEALLMPCGADIVNAIHAQTAMLDARLGGIVYTDLGIDPDTGLNLYEPELPVVTNPANFVAPGMQHGTRIIEWGMLNLLQGDINGPYGQSEQLKQQLVDILAAIQAIDPGEQIDYTPLIQAILVALGA